MKSRITIGVVLCAAIGTLWPVSLLAEEKKVDPEHYVHVYGIAEYYEWHEFSDGKTLLIESGPLYGGEIDGGYTENQKIWFRYRGKIFAGDVDYDGALQNGTPWSSTTDYRGGELALEGDLITLASSTAGDVLNIYLGLGFRGWQRDLTGDAGYSEYWKTYYITTGLWGRYHLSADGKILLTGKLEARLPFYNHERVDLQKFGLGQVTLRPGWAPSLYSSVGLDASFVSVEAYVQALYFSESDVVYPGFYQPESLGMMAGLKAGIVF